METAFRIRRQQQTAARVRYTKRRFDRLDGAAADVCQHDDVGLADQNLSL